jgi:hypothetical protein
MQQVDSMHRRKQPLSADDRKAVDVLLDQAANTADSGVVPHAPAVAHSSIAAASKVLQLLSQLPTIDPPKNLVARTMQRIDQDIAARAARHEGSRRSATASHVH